MKEMIYKPDRELEILDEGIIDGRQYYIISFGTHPCAYVKVFEEELKDKDGFEDWDIDCHGGVTFCSTLSTINADGTYQDYYGDYGFYREHFSISKDIKKKAKNILENS